MIITAKQKNTRQSPRKVRLVANEVKSLPLSQAVDQLAVIERRASFVILKTIKQAVSNAINNHGYSVEDLTLKNILVTEGSRHKRFRAVSRGRAHSVIKRTCHVEVILEVGQDAKKTASSDQNSKKSEKKTDTKSNSKKETIQSSKKTKVSKKASKKSDSEATTKVAKKKKTTKPKSNTAQDSMKPGMKQEKMVSQRQQNQVRARRKTQTSK